LITVVFDQELTETARYADNLLPPTKFLEHTDRRSSYGSMYFFESRPAIAPVGQSRPNYEVFADLCDRLGLSRPEDPSGPEQLFDAIVAASPQATTLRAQLAAAGVAVPPCSPNPVQFVDVFPNTADRRVHLVPAELDAEAPRGLYRYDEEEKPGKGTLGLISPATSKTISSTFGQLIKEQVPLELNPTDAEARGIADGARVRVWNEFGEVHCLAVRSADLPAGVALLPKGLWSHSTLNGNTANALAPDSLADLAGGACFNDARVEVELLE
jgi:anaerobic selenocysteine-containing dehydrogenase